MCSRWILPVFLIACPLSAGAGARIVVLRSSAFALYEEVVKGVRRCNPGEVLDDVSLTDDSGKNDALLAGARAKNPNIILAVGTAAARFAREKSSSIPTVFAAVIDPSSTGLAPPGAPMDVDPAAEVAFVRKNFPQVKRLGVLYSPGRNVDAVSRFKALRDQGEAIALIEVPSIDKLEEAIQTLAEQSDGLLMLTDPVIYSPQTAPQLILKTLQRGLPIFAVSPAFVKAGAMAGIYTDPEQNGCTAAAVAGRVAAGDKAASRSYQLSSEYRSSANPVVAKRLNINLPAALAGGAEQTVK